MDSTETRQLRMVYEDVINGYSVDYFQDKLVYVRHIGLKEQSIVDKTYLQIFAEAISKGIPTEQERLKKLYELGQWTKKDDEFVRDCESMLSGLQKARATVMLKSDLKRISDEIQNEEAKLNNKLTQKYVLLGTTAESITNKKINDLFLNISLFKDEQLMEPLFDKKQFDEDFTEDEIDNLYTFYYSIINKIGHKTIRKIAIAQFFQDILSFSTSCLDFFGKPMVKLTYFQSDLYAWGKHFHRLLEGQTPPNSVRDDPDKLIDWITSTRAMRAEIERMASKGMDVSIVGASKDDYIESGYGQQFVDLARADKKTLEKYT